MKYGAAIAVGVLATVAVEKPVLRLRDRLLPAKDVTAADPAVEIDAPQHAHVAWTPPTVPFTLPARSDPLVRVAA